MINLTIFCCFCFQRTIHLSTRIYQCSVYRLFVTSACGSRSRFGSVMGMAKHARSHWPPRLRFELSHKSASFWLHALLMSLLAYVLNQHIGCEFSSKLYGKKDRNGGRGRLRQSDLDQIKEFMCSIRNLKLGS